MSRVADRPALQILETCGLFPTPRQKDKVKYLLETLNLADCTWLKFDKSSEQDDQYYIVMTGSNYHYAYRFHLCEAFLCIAFNVVKLYNADQPAAEAKCLNLVHNIILKHIMPNEMNSPFDETTVCYHDPFRGMFYYWQPVKTKEECIRFAAIDIENKTGFFPKMDDRLVSFVSTMIDVPYGASKVGLSHSEQMIVKMYLLTLILKNPKFISKHYFDHKLTRIERDYVADSYIFHFLNPGNETIAKLRCVVTKNTGFDKLSHRPRALNEFNYLNLGQDERMYEFMCELGIADQNGDDLRIHTSTHSLKDFYITYGTEKEFKLENVRYFVHLNGEKSYAKSVYASEHKLIKNGTLNDVTLKLDSCKFKIGLHTKVEYDDTGVLWIYDDEVNAEDIKFFKFSSEWKKHRSYCYNIQIGSKYLPKFKWFKREVEKLLAPAGEQFSSAKYGICETFLHDMPECDPHTSKVKLSYNGEKFTYCIVPLTDAEDVKPNTQSNKYPKPEDLIKAHIEYLEATFHETIAEAVQNKKYMVTVYKFTHHDSPVVIDWFKKLCQDNGYRFERIGTMIEIHLLG